jgi:hypothetical protein
MYHKGHSFGVDVIVLLNDLWAIEILEVTNLIQCKDNTLLMDMTKYW